MVVLYYIAKPLINITYRIFFRKIYFSNSEAIPKDRAILFAVNHPTAFLDPIFVASFIGPSTSFLLRGDMFKKPFVIWLLKQLKTIPIFRARDGFANLKNNQNTFDYVYGLLKDGKHVLVLAEGETKHEKRLRPIQKGTARIVTGLEELHPGTKLCILPLAVNYTDSHQFRSEFMAKVGSPILVENYLSNNKENPRRAVKQMTDEITRQLREMVVHIEDDADAPFVNRILDFHRNDRNTVLLPTYTTSSIALDTEMRITKSINDYTLDNKNTLREKVEAYDAFLNKNDLKDVGLAGSRFFSILNTLILILGIPVFIIGYLNNYISLTLGRNVADSKTKKIEFHSSVRFGVIMGSYFFLFSTVMLIFLIIGNWYWIGALCLMPVMGFLSIIYGDLYMRWNAARKWKGVDKSEKGKIETLRDEIIGMTS